MPSWICSAIVFDLDGVLVDSNATSERHWQVWAAQRGIDYAEIEAIHFGRPTVEVIRKVAPHLDAVREAEGKENTEADDTTTLQAFPGVASLLSALPVGRWGVATSGKRRTATIRLNYTGLPIPEVFVTANDITRGKPDPEPYLLATKRLGFHPADCVVIEDAPSGIRSAKAAGARVIGVTTTNPPSALSEADLILNAFADLQLKVLPDGRLEFHWDGANERSADQ